MPLTKLTTLTNPFRAPRVSNQRVRDPKVTILPPDDPSHIILKASFNYSITTVLNEFRTYSIIY